MIINLTLIPQICNVVILYVCYFFSFTSSSVVYNIDDMPVFNPNDQVAFYYCETSLPYNVPSYIKYKINLSLFYHKHI